MKVTFRGERVVWERKFTGRLRAYLAVRWQALMWDIWTPDYDGEVGINWRITGT